MQPQEMQDEQVNTGVSNVTNMIGLISICLAFSTFGLEFLSLTEFILVH